MIDGDTCGERRSLMRRAEDISSLRRIIAFGLILVSYVFYSFAWNTVDILRPYIQESLDLSLQQAGLSYTAQSIGALLGAVVLAQLADRFGRRNLLAFVTFGYGAALLLGLAVTDLTELLLQRLLLGFFLGGVFACAVGLYVGLFPPGIRGRLASFVGVSYAVGVMVQGWLGRSLLDTDWTLMLWIGGFAPLGIAVVLFTFVPDDRRMLPWGGSDTAAAKPAKVPALELFAAPYRSLTIRLVALTGLNFLGYQAFFGWATTFLRDVRGLDGSAIGTVVTFAGFGGAIGGLAWGWAADRAGRKIGVLGFVGVGILMAAFVVAPANVALLSALYLGISLCMSAQVVWGIYFAEMFPSHLRSTAASIFNWGRIFSFLAPVATGALAAAAGMQASLLAGAVVFAMSALLWFTLPETLSARSSERPK